MDRFPEDIRHTPLGRGCHALETAIRLSRPLEEVFAFFTDVGNLERITPPELAFRIVTPLPVTIAEGALIDYRLRLYGVPLRWRTRISVWEPPLRFEKTAHRRVLPGRGFHFQKLTIAALHFGTGPIRPIVLAHDALDFHALGVQKTTGDQGGHRNQV